MLQSEFCKLWGCYMYVSRLVCLNKNKICTLYIVQNFIRLLIPASTKMRKLGAKLMLPMSTLIGFIAWTGFKCYQQLAKMLLRCTFWLALAQLERTWRQDVTMTGRDVWENILLFYYKKHFWSFNVIFWGAHCPIGQLTFSVSKFFICSK